MSFIKDLVKGKAEYKNGRIIRKKKSRLNPTIGKKHDSSSDSDSNKKTKKKEKRESLYERTGIGAPSSKDKYYKREKLPLLESDKKRIKDIDKNNKRKNKILQIKKLLEYNNKMDKIDKLLDRISKLEKPLAREESQVAQGAERPNRGFLSRYFEPSIVTPNNTSNNVEQPRPLTFKFESNIRPPQSPVLSNLQRYIRPNPMATRDQSMSFLNRTNTDRSVAQPVTPSVSPAIPSPFSRPSVGV